MDGCSGFAPDHHTVPISNIQLAADCDRQGNQQVKGETCTDGHSKKLQQPRKGPLQPFFRNKKPQNPYLQILVFSHI
jgi:hypothetical protein